MKDFAVFVKEFCVRLKSANGPIEVYLCPDNIDVEASSDAAAEQPVTYTTDDVVSSDPSSSSSVVKQEGMLLFSNRPQ